MRYAPPSEPWKVRLNDLELRETALSQRFERVRREYSGLFDIELALELIKCRIDIALLALGVMSDRSLGFSATDILHRKASVAARTGVSLFNELVGACAESDETLDSFSLYPEVRSAIDALILAGGAGFFREHVEEGAAHEFLLGVVADAIRKYAAPDDRYRPLFGSRRRRGVFASFLYRFLPMSARETEFDPCGVDESEVEHVGTIALPLPQAILFYEREVLPEVEPSGGERAERVRRIISELRSISVRPRARPLLHPGDYYTAGLVRFSSEGEPLVPVSIPAAYRTGTNLDRVMELVRDEVTRNIAGTGLLPALDAELDRLRSLESGRAGSALFPRSRLDTRRWFPRLKERFPQVAVLENRKVFPHLLDRAKSRRGLLRAVRRELSAGSHSNGRAGHSQLLGN